MAGEATIDMSQDVVVLEDGKELPIVRYLDYENIDCMPDEAASVVAGTREYGWLRIDIIRENVTVH